jgi:hypothetical protein
LGHSARPPTAGPLSPLSDEECAVWTKQASELLQSVIIPLKQQMLDKITKLEIQYRTTEQQATQASLGWIANKTEGAQSVYLASLQEVEKTLKQLTLLVDPVYTFYEGALSIIGNIIRGIKAPFQPTTAAYQAGPASSSADQADTASGVVATSTTTSVIMQTMASAHDTAMVSLSKLQEKIEEIEGLVKSLSETPSQENIITCNNKMGIVLAHLQEREDLSAELSAKLYDAQVTLRETTEKFVKKKLFINDCTGSSPLEPWERAVCYLSLISKEELLGVALLKKRPRLIACLLAYMDHSQLQKAIKIGSECVPPLQYCLNYLDSGMIPCLVEFTQREPLMWLTADRSGYPIAHTVLSYQDGEHPLRDSLFNQHTTQSDLIRLYRGLIDKLTDYLQKQDLSEESQQSIHSHIQHYKNQLENRVTTLLALTPLESTRWVTDPHHFGQQMAQGFPELSSLIREVQANPEINQKIKKIYQAIDKILSFLKKSTKDREKKNRIARTVSSYFTNVESFLHNMQSTLRQYIQMQVALVDTNGPHNREARLTQLVDQVTNFLDEALVNITYSEEFIKLHQEAEQINHGKQCSKRNKKRVNAKIEELLKKIMAFQEKIDATIAAAAAAAADDDDDDARNTASMQININEEMQKENDRAIKMQEISTQLKSLYRLKVLKVQQKIEMLDELDKMGMDKEITYEALPAQWKAQFSTLEEKCDALQREIDSLTALYEKLKQERVLSEVDIRAILPAGRNLGDLSSAETAIATSAATSQFLREIARRAAETAARRTLTEQTASPSSPSSSPR